MLLNVCAAGLSFGSRVSFFFAIPQGEPLPPRRLVVVATLVAYDRLHQAYAFGFKAFPGYGAISIRISFRRRPGSVKGSL